MCTHPMFCIGAICAVCTKLCMNPGTWSVQYCSPGSDSNYCYCTFVFYTELDGCTYHTKYMYCTVQTVLYGYLGAEDRTVHQFARLFNSESCCWLILRIYDVRDGDMTMTIPHGQHAHNEVCLNQCEILIEIPYFQCPQENS